MKRNLLDQLNLRSNSRFFKFEPVKNILFDFYLDGFKRREKNKEKLSIVIVNYLITISFIVCIVKYAVGFMPMSYTTKLITFDMALFFGGIELYNRIFFILGLILGLVAHIKLHWSKSGSHKEWTQLFEIRRGKDIDGVIKRSRINEATDLVKVMKVIYKIWSTFLFILSKNRIKLNYTLCTIKAFMTLIR